MTCALRLYQGGFGRVALLDSDKDLVTHAHPQCHVLIKASGADTSFEVRGQRVPLTRDSMVLVNAWEPHSKVHHGTAGSSAVLVMYIEPAWLEALDPQLAVAGLQGFFPEACVAIPPHVRLLADRLVGGMLEDGRPGGHVPGEQFTDRRADGRADGRAGERWEAALGELAMSVVHEFSAWREREAIRRASLRRLSDPRVNRALQLMRQDPGAGLSFDAVARNCGLSRPHFFHLFRACTAVSPAVYLNALRMETAFGRLVQDGVAITEVASGLGFSEPQHFTRFFRQNLGIPPSEYQRTVELFG